MKCFFLNTHYNPILFEPVIGNTFSCFHFQAVEITWLLIQEISTQTNKCLQNWKLRVPTMTALTALYWQAQVQKHFSDVYLSFECFNILFMWRGVWYVFLIWWNKHRTFFFLFSLNQVFMTFYPQYDDIFDWKLYILLLVWMLNFVKFYLECVICLIATAGLEAIDFHFAKC